MIIVYKTNIQVIFSIKHKHSVSNTSSKLESRALLLRTTTTFACNLVDSCFSCDIHYSEHSVRGGFENVKTRSPFNFGPWRIDAVGHPMYNILLYVGGFRTLYSGLPLINRQRVLPARGSIVPSIGILLHRPGKARRRGFKVTFSGHLEYP